jgi:PPK2 family polyphosphate:nucleotide phosphotransferase
MRLGECTAHSAIALKDSWDAMSKQNRIAARFRIENGKNFKLKHVDPADTGQISSKEEAKQLLEEGIAALQDMQDKLYAQDQWALLIVIQAMDAAGKDSLIKHVMSGVNPAGCEVHSFKAPSAEELDHDFLWRHAFHLPARGKIGIFNRSHYEEVLVVRVHRELLHEEKIPRPLVTKKIWKERLEDICAWERYLGRNGVVIRKFLLHVSREEQRRRFLSRLEEPEKNWKFSPSDVKERKYLDTYMAAYEDAVRHTATPDAPWYVVPADNKWFTQLVVASAIVDTLRELRLTYPRVSGRRKQELLAAKRLLERNSK